MERLSSARLPSTPLSNARAQYAEFLSTVEAPEGDFRLTRHAEPTPYSRCFALFGFQLLGDSDRLTAGAKQWATAIRRDIDQLRADRLAAGRDLASDKPYQHLLTFSLSALRVLNQLEKDPLEDHVLPLLSNNVDLDLARAGVLEGTPRSGNQAMFMAILLLHARQWLNVDDGGRIARWADIMLAGMNRLGFWGPASSMSHLQFQNGYHQYEILEYLGVPVPLWDAAADNVALLADPDAHFAPYAGGSGCYDYDAVFLITGAAAAAVSRHRKLLLRTAGAILSEQNPDGGFCESHCIRPRSLASLRRSVRHVWAGRGRARLERLRYGLTLLRPYHDRMHTHWSRYSREWSESDVWDSWFRMLTLARIDVALDPSRAREWGFIDYPGIGYHACLRSSGGRS